MVVECKCYQRKALIQKEILKDKDETVILCSKHIYYKIVLANHK